MYAHAGAVLNGRIYITCGRRGMVYLRETYCFDPRANTWTACAEGPVERAWHGVAAVNGRIYVIGGSNDEFSYRCDVVKVRRLKSSGVFTVDDQVWKRISATREKHHRFFENLGGQKKIDSERKD